jgi:hypothetical protein
MPNLEIPDGFEGEGIAVKEGCFFPGEEFFGEYVWPFQLL